MFEWLIKHVYQAGVHSPGDGAAFVRVARLWARCLECDEWTSENGMLACDPKTQRQSVHPIARLSRDMWRLLGGALDQIGASAGSRYRVAGPLKAGQLMGKNDWDDID